MAAMSSPAEPAAPAGKFEELLERLEQIVSDMEAAELPLEKLLSSYEEGMRLVKACGDRLADAEQKVEILSKAAPVAPPVSPADTALVPPKAEEDIRLI
jgi:exodeoxyribonuclease VII small subunit